MFIDLFAPSKERRKGRLNIQQLALGGQAVCHVNCHAYADTAGNVVHSRANANANADGGADYDPDSLFME